MTNNIYTFIYFTHQPITNANRHARSAEDDEGKCQEQKSREEREKTAKINIKLTALMLLNLQDGHFE